MTREQPQRSGTREAWLAGGLAVAALLVMAPGPRVSPDSLELLETVRCQAGLSVCTVPSTWPPLWPTLLVPLARSPLQIAAWTLNLVLAGAVAVPLWLASSRLGGRWAARGSVLCWVLLPVVRQHAVILDPRPMAWLMAAWVLALCLRAGLSAKAWWPAFAVAALAPLARPEGVFLLPLVGVAALLARRSPAKVLGGLAVASLPLAVWLVSKGGGRFGYELMGLSWNGIWDNADFVALLGPATAGTGFREMMQAAVRAGIETPPLDPHFAWLLLPAGLASLGTGLLGALGLVGLTGVGLAVYRLGLRGWRARIALAAGLSPLAVLVMLPMSWGQMSEAVNLLFLLPGLLALAWAGWARLVPRRRQALLLGLVALAVAELHLAPWKLEPPRYVESSAASTRMASWLADNPPVGRRVACTFAGRGLVRQAGLEPVTLPSSWEAWDPRPSVPVLLAPDLLEDGGRGLLLLEDPAWVPTAWVGPVHHGAEGGDWYLYLVPAPSS